MAAAKQKASEASKAPEQRSGGQDFWRIVVVFLDLKKLDRKAGLIVLLKKSRTPRIKGFSFEDDRLVLGNWAKEPNAESPGEGGFLVAYREFGFEFCKRTQSSVSIRERYFSSKNPIERS